MSVIIQLVYCLFLVSLASTQRKSLAENDPCGSGESRGICKKNSDCSVIRDLINKGVRPEVCGFIDKAPIICCPQLLSQKAGESNTQLNVGNLKGAENDPCGFGKSRGVCKKLADCKAIRDLIDKGIRPDVCGFINKSPIICCPQDLNQNSGEPHKTSGSQAHHNQGKRKSVEKCEEYAKSVVETTNVVALPGEPVENITRCAWNAEELIVGGETANPKVYIHMALVGYGKLKEWLCGGSLISQRFILSAAHCYEVYNMKAEWVRLGELDLSSKQDEARPIDLKIVNHFVHPSYIKGKSYHDIALFELEADVQFSSYIRPICLQESLDIKTSFKPIVTGWGHTTFKGEFSDDLMQLKVDLVPTNQCKTVFKRFESSKKSLIPQGIDGDIMLCAGGEVGKDSCSGDSGGPLQIPLTKPFCMFKQIGIVSFGNKCAIGDPGVYTRISYYIDWIESLVWPN